ncbi:MAG TPA: CoA-binding protein [Syntrophorhabdaceae bacterium]|nr:CoA-binding protein [Syntrophorhabdaceae bacterium]
MMNKRLKNLFSPKSVAVIGASQSLDKLGFHVMKSLVKGGYRGSIYPVNPRSENLWGIKAYPDIKSIPYEIDLGIIVVPAAMVPSVLQECGERMVKGIVLITAGYKEIEEEKGMFMENEIKDIASKYEMPIIGPNTFGFVNLTDGVNASFTYEFSLIKKGGVTLISQSGGFCHLCGFLAIEERLGMAKLMSLGNRVNIDFPEAMEYFLEEDEATKVIALYIEGIDEPRRLFDTVKQKGLKKPIIAFKAGKSEKGDSASRFHTGSLAGNYNIWKGALRQSSILEVTQAEELMDIAKVIDVCAPAKGPNIAVLSSQAGPGIIACDALEKNGLRLSRFSQKTQDRINELLPPVAIRTNPVDMGPAWYSPETILNILLTVLDDDGTDGIIFIAMFASANLELIGKMASLLQEIEPFNKPVICCFTAPPGVWDKDIEKMDGKNRIAIIHTPERAARAMANLWKTHMLMERDIWRG